jgi:hypothetical protein
MRTGTCVIVLALLVLAAGCGGYGKSGSKSTSSEVTVTLAQQNGSGESGTATLTKVGNQTKVVIDLKNSSDMALSLVQPAHIHKGSCATLGAVEYPLTNVKSGKSTTTVSAKLDDLQKGAYAINVHKSAADIKTYVACGDIGTGKSSGGSGGSGY